MKRHEISRISALLALILTALLAAHIPAASNNEIRRRAATFRKADKVYRPEIQHIEMNLRGAFHGTNENRNSKCGRQIPWRPPSRLDGGWVSG